MRKEQITVTNNSVCNSAENKGLEGKGMKRRLLHFKKRMVPAVFPFSLSFLLFVDFSLKFSLESASTSVYLHFYAFQ